MLNEAEPQTAAARKRWADYMRARGRRLGAVPVKGTAFLCERCGGGVARTSVRQKWCAACKPLAVADDRIARRLKSGHVPIGALLICRKCGGEFPKQHKRQFYCDGCKEVEPNTGRRVGEPWTCAHCSSAIIVQHSRMIYCDDCRTLQKRGALPSTRAAMAARAKIRRQTDPQYALSRNIGTAIRHSLADGKGGRSWEALVGYTIADLMLHLERQFLKGMTWDRMGSEIHVDHIIPLSKFNFTSADDPEFKLAWSITNLRPLWKRENLLKSGNRTLLL
jgi:hypothetical protein